MFPDYFNNQKERWKIMKRSLALLTLLLAGAAIPAFPAGKVADDFAAPDSGDLWEVNLGYNLKNTIPRLSAPKQGYRLNG